METLTIDSNPGSSGPDIISNSENVGLDLKLLYRVVIDISAEGLYTTNPTLRSKNKKYCIYR